MRDIGVVPRDVRSQKGFLDRGDWREEVEYRRLRTGYKQYRDRADQEEDVLVVRAKQHTKLALDFKSSY